eukprot:969517_1
MSKTTAEVQDYESSKQDETPEETAVDSKSADDGYLYGLYKYYTTSKVESSGAISRNRIGGAFLGSSFVTVAGTMVAAIVNLLCNGAVIKMILTYPCLQPCFEKHKWFKDFLMFIFTYTAVN